MEQPAGSIPIGAVGRFELDEREEGIVEALRKPRLQARRIELAHLRQVADDSDAACQMQIYPLLVVLTDHGYARAISRLFDLAATHIGKEPQHAAEPGQFSLK